ncbi:unnamed protein product [Caenorhabditis brenneri]
MSSSNVRNDNVETIPKEENMENQHPKVLLGDYEIVRELGKGSYGKVLHVVHKVTNVKYALKLFNKNVVLEKNQIGDLKKEFNIMRDLDSEFVVNLVQVFYTPQNVCFVMDYCQGGNFRYVIKANGPMDIYQGTFYSAELFCAIKYLHENNVVHQDLKPENLLLTESGHLKICDFGLSELIMCPQAKLNRRCGSRLYLSPEKVLGIEYTKSSDWWTFGLLIGDFFGCHFPFKRATSQGTEAAIANLKMEWEREMPKYAMDLVGALLKYEHDRLTQEEISQHRFFWRVNWEDFDQQRVLPPDTYNRQESDVELSQFMETEDSIDIDEDNDVFNTFCYKRFLMN